MAVTANVQWIAASGATSYRVEYKLQSSSTWTLFNASLVGTSVSIINLQEGTAYDFRVTSNCVSGTSSPISIQQATPCKPVDNLQGDFVGTTANLSWVKKPNAQAYIIEYKTQGSPTWLTASGSPLSNSGLPDPVTFSISGLTAGTAYDFQVKVSCQVGESTGSVISISSGCIAPTNLSVTFV